MSGVPSKKFFDENPDGVKMHEGWQTVKATSLRRVDLKDAAGSDAPAIAIDIINQDGEKGSLWLKTDNSTNKVWGALARIFNLDWEEDTEMDSLVALFTNAMLGNPFDLLVKHAMGKGNNEGKIFVNFIDFAPAGEGEGTETYKKPEPVDTAKKEAAPKKVPKW